MTKIYYGPNNNTGDQYRLSPAPQISISTTPYYSGDVIIGYTHTVSLRGYAAAYRKTNNTDPSHSVVSLGLVADNIATVKQILSRNGSTLVVIDEQGTNNSTAIKCKGGTLQSLSFNESPNNWMGYAEYSAQIEFNEIELINGASLETIACSESYLDSNSISPSIVDISKYKIKSFTDSWSISVDETIYSRIFNTDTQNMETDNSSMSVSYTVSATGKNYYNGDDLVPAWQQAKNFAQSKLYAKVMGLLTSTLGITASIACGANTSLAGLGGSTNGALQNLNSGYGVYNETVSCTTSESDGTFSVTYNAIIKKKNTSTTNDPNSRHTFTKTLNVSNDTRKITTISIQGTVEGLIEGGMVRAIGSGFQLPQTGSIIISSNTVTKYSNALTGFNKISDGINLLPTIRTKLGITLSALGITSSQLSGCTSPVTDQNLEPSSFNLTHNYHEGIINYTAEYSSNIVCGQSGAMSSMSVSVENPVPVLAEFPIPNSDLTIVQDIKTVTAKKINISIEGRGQKQCCLSSQDISNSISSISFTLPTGLTLPDETQYILTTKQRTNNLIEGSYSISLGYICAVGCS